jgi:UDP-N-acetylglucosamine 1-carboxyvinyltransferase
MEFNTFEVIGGKTLSGSIEPQGAKNEALQILCAVLLTPESIEITNVPEILDVKNLILLLEGFGVQVTRMEEGRYVFKAENVDIRFLESDEFVQASKKIRGSVMLMGPLLARFGKITLPMPGGDKIGRRRLDTHLIGLEQLGATFNYNSERRSFDLKTNQLKGTNILMDEISVTGTANMVMAAVLAKGTTTIYNAACEPYVQQLCHMLIRMGAQIRGVGSNLLEIEGVSYLRGTSHTIQPDMIEIGSFIGLAAMTRSTISISNSNLSELGIIPSVFRKLGVDVEQNGKDILVPGKESYVVQPFIDGGILTVYDAPWPGFTPDLMSILLVVATQARGSVLIHQKMFESRLFFVDKLIDMGAQIILCDPHRATVIGMDWKQKLKGIQMTSPDIRAGVALLIAALSAQGTSYIHNIQQIDRGYQKIDERLNQLGANIRRIA